MTKPKPLPVEGLFDRDGQEKKVNRLLQKALEKRVKATQKNPSAKIRFPVAKGTRAQKSKLGESLAKAISSQFGSQATTPSHVGDTGAASHNPRIVHPPGGLSDVASASSIVATTAAEVMRRVHSK